MNRVAIIGCGNIGYRHLSAAASLPAIDEIYVVEPNDHRRLQCLRDNPPPSAGARLIGLKSVRDLVDLQTDLQLVISAVTSDVQTQLAPQIAGLMSSALLLEKPVAQGTRALAGLVAVLSGKRVFVNCARGLWSGYSEARQLLSETQVHLEASGNLLGLGCNAVHFLELFRYLTSTSHVFASNAQFQLSPLGNKRGIDYEEFIGTASFRTERGDTLQLTSGFVSERPSTVSLIAKESATGKILLVVDEGTGSLWLPQGELLARRSLGMLHVSQSTGLFLDALLNDAPLVAALPTLEAVRSSHEALYNCLTTATGREHFRIT